MAPNKCVCPSGFTGSNCEKGNLSPFVGSEEGQKEFQREGKLSLRLYSMWVDLMPYVSMGDVAPQNGYV